MPGARSVSLSSSQVSRGRTRSSSQQGPSRPALRAISVGAGDAQVAGPQRRAPGPTGGIARRVAVAGRAGRPAPGPVSGLAAGVPAAAPRRAGRRSGPGPDRGLVARCAGAAVQSPGGMAQARTRPAADRVSGCAQRKSATAGGMARQSGRAAAHRRAGRAIWAIPAAQRQLVPADRGARSAGPRSGAQLGGSPRPARAACSQQSRQWLFFSGTTRAHTAQAARGWRRRKS